MPITYDPRPTFLIQRTLGWLGAPRPSRTLALSGTDLDDTIRDDRLLDAWWTELEGLIVALNLAGYECPELIVAHRDQPTGWLRLPVWIGLEDGWDPEDPLVIVGDGDWRALTGVAPDVVPAIATRLTLLRVEVRRTVDTPVRKAEERPPRFPPIPLDGLVPGFQPGPPGSTDPFADPLDGWIAFGHLTAAAGESGALKTAHEMGALADDTRDLLVDALVAEWQRAKPADVGLIRCLDPATWDSPLDRAAWVWPFDVLWQEIWARADAAGGTQLRAWLKEPTDSKAVSLRQLSAATSWGGSGDAVAALRDRGKRLGVTDESLEQVLAQLPSRNWLLGLFMLHGSSLVRLLPFPVQHEPAIKFIDLTGWYETTYADAGRPVNAAMQLNHAGHRLVGWFQDSDLNRWDVELQRVAFDPDGSEPLDPATGAGRGETTDSVQSDKLARQKKKAENPATDPRLTKLSDDIAKTPDVKSVSPPSLDKRGTAAVYTVISDSSPSSEKTEDLVNQLRDETIPKATKGSDVNAWVGGQTAGYIDLASGGRRLRRRDLRPRKATARR